MHDAIDDVLKGGSFLFMIIEKNRPFPFFKRIFAFCFFIMKKTVICCSFHRLLVSALHLPLLSASK